MFKTRNSDFVLTPVSSILKEGVAVFETMRKSISLYPISEYVLSSIFLKMSGAQEQKLKCICWDMATENPEFRFDYLKDASAYGEFSTYKAKNKVFNSLIEQIKYYDDTFTLLNIDFRNIIKDTKQELDSLADCLLFDCFKKQYRSFDSNYKRIFKVNQVGLSLNNNKVCALLFNSQLQEIYDKFVYRKRNQVAHNTLSYQSNTQIMKHMSQAEFIHNNYITRFAILILIDKVFIELFKKYLESIIELDFGECCNDVE